MHNDQIPAEPATAPSAAEDLELAMAISASIQSALQENPPLLDANLSSGASTSCTQNSSVNTSGSNPVASKAPAPLASIESPRHGTAPSGNSCSIECDHIQHDSVASTIQSTDLIPSAPPIPDGPIHYPSIDSSPVDFSSPAVESAPAKLGDKKEDGGSSSCVICLDAPVEGACIPCGHMAGCMSCLNEIKTKKWGCPLCRAEIDQIIRLYAV